MQKSLLIIGLMGVGKTTIGRLLASELGLSFLDMDETIEAREKKSIGRIFQDHGEPHFRVLEKRLLEERLQTSDTSVIAAGGGAVCDDEAQEIVRSRCIQIWLDAPIDVLVDRLQQTGDRPLLHGRDLKAVLTVLKEKRRDYYRKADIRIDVGKGNQADIVAHIKSELRNRGLIREDHVPREGKKITKTNAITVQLGSSSYPIIFSTGSKVEFMETLKSRFLPGVVGLVTDSNVGAIYLKSIADELKMEQYNPVTTTVKPGEGSKSIQTAGELYDEFISSAMTRDRPIIALGGGVVGDLSGFVASTLYRGVPFIQIPTTLLAQVDASIGGKTGINHPLGKNLIGTFYQPSFVFIHPGFLDTLSAREYISGIAEVIKMAAIRDEKLFRFLENHRDGIINREQDIVIEMIQSACRIKADVVMADEKESYLRMILNYGHTFGHAIEAEDDYRRYLHGEAVSLGMLVANDIGSRLGISDTMDSVRVSRLIDAFGLPTDHHRYVDRRIIERITKDKKVRDQAVHLILLEKIGKCRIHKITLEALMASCLTAR